MTNRVLLKKSSVTAKVPLTTDLEYGELALNYADGKLYFKDSSNAIEFLGSSSATQTLSNKTLSSAILTGTITAGGGVGTSGQVLSSTGTGVQWVNAGGGGGITDGDKGDITVSGSGAVWTIDDGIVNTSKLGGDITTAGKALLDDADAAAQRTTLGLGTAATTNSTAYATSAQGSLADTALQPTYVENAYLINYTNLGVLATTITLDINKKWNIGEFTGSDTTHTINAISPTVSTLEPAHFTFVNNGSVTKTVVFNSSILSIAGSTLSQVTLPIGYKIDFDIRRNPLNVGASYEAKVGDVNYNQTASGLDTTWNPSDYSGTPPLTLSNGNKTIEMTTATAAYRSSRAFGQKTTGRWLFAIRCDAIQGGGSQSVGAFAIGIATPTTLLSTCVGNSVNTGSFFMQRTSGVATVTIDEGVSTTRVAFSPAINDIIVIAYNVTTGKGYVNYNNTWLYSGNPEADTSPIFTLATGNNYLPMISFFESGVSGNGGIWTLLTEIDIASVMATVPSYQYWTA
jgi:hypothetical protein